MEVDTLKVSDQTQLTSDDDTKYIKIFFQRKKKFLKKVILYNCKNTEGSIICHGKSRGKSFSKMLPYYTLSTITHSQPSFSAWKFVVKSKNE